MKPNFTNAFFRRHAAAHRVLRRAVVCMLLLGTTVVHAQERKITVDTRQEVTLVQLFRQVEASSDYLFNYKDQDVADIRVSVKVADASIQEVMDLALARTSLTYTVKGRHVIIGQSAARSAGTPPRTDSRPVALTGRVTDEKGMPFVGVTIAQAACLLKKCVGKVWFHCFRVGSLKVLVRCRDRGIGPKQNGIRSGGSRKNRKGEDRDLVSS